MVQRMTGLRAMSANELSQEVGVSQTSLSSWLRRAGEIRAKVTTAKETRVAKTDTAEGRLAAVLVFSLVEGTARKGLPATVEVPTRSSIAVNSVFDDLDRGAGSVALEPPIGSPSAAVASRWLTARQRRARPGHRRDCMRRRIVNANFASS
jgi:hypothetical protein